MSARRLRQAKTSMKILDSYELSKKKRIKISSGQTHVLWNLNKLFWSNFRWKRKYGIEWAERIQEIATIIIYSIINFLFGEQLTLSWTSPQYNPPRTNWSVTSRPHTHQKAEPVNKFWSQLYKKRAINFRCSCSRRFQTVGTLKFLSFMIFVVPSCKNDMNRHSSHSSRQTFLSLQKDEISQLVVKKSTYNFSILLLKFLIPMSVNIMLWLKFFIMCFATKYWPLRKIVYWVSKQRLLNPFSL